MKIEQWYIVKCVAHTIEHYGGSTVQRRPVRSVIGQNRGVAIDWRDTEKAGSNYKLLYQVVHLIY